MPTKHDQLLRASQELTLNLMLVRSILRRQLTNEESAAFDLVLGVCQDVVDGRRGPIPTVVRELVAEWDRSGPDGVGELVERLRGELALKALESGSDA